jgi:shikimate kinase
MTWPAFDTDALIEKRERRPISDIFSKDGEAYFREAEAAALDSILLEGERGVVATGGGLPTIEGMMKRMSRQGITVYLAASIDELWNRLTVNRAELDKRPLLRDGGRAALERMLRRRERVYESAQLTVRTDGLPPDRIAAHVLATISPLLMSE